MHLPGKVVGAMYAQTVRRAVGRGSNWVNQEDLESEGIAGLIRGVETYDPSKGVEASTWLSLKIKGAVMDALRRMDTLSKDDRALRNTAKRAVTAEEFAEAARIERETAAKIMRGERMAAAVPFSAIKLAGGCEFDPEMTRGLPGTSNEFWETMRKRCGDAPGRAVFAVMAQTLSGMSGPEIARALGLRSQPEWLRKILRTRGGVLQFTLGSTLHNSLRYRPRGKKARHTWATLMGRRKGEAGPDRQVHPPEV